MDEDDAGRLRPHGRVGGRAGHRDRDLPHPDALPRHGALRSGWRPRAGSCTATGTSTTRATSSSARAAMTRSGAGGRLLARLPRLLPLGLDPARRRAASRRCRTALRHVAYAGGLEEVRAAVGPGHPRAAHRADAARCWRRCCPASAARRRARWRLSEHLRRVRLQRFRDHVRGQRQRAEGARLSAMLRTPGRRPVAAVEDLVGHLGEAREVAQERPRRDATRRPCRRAGSGGPGRRPAPSTAGGRRARCTIVRSGKSTATSSTAIGSPWRLRAPGKTDVPVWIMTGSRSRCASS